MKINKWTSLLTTSSIVCSFSFALMNNPAVAQTQGVKFVCETVKGTPVTSSIRNKTQKQFIRWVDTMGDGKYTPTIRCKEVTQRLNTHFSQGGQYITHGIWDRQPAICLTDQEGGGCKELLLTLDYREDDPKQKLEDFFKANDSNFSGITLKEKCPLYIDSNAFIAGKQKFAKYVCR